MLVVGAGIVGASIAYHVARRGVQVTVIDRAGPAAGASSHGFAWINASFPKQPFSYHLLNRLGVLAYRRLQLELGLSVRWGGSLQWFEDPRAQARLRADVRRQQALGMPVRMLDPETVGRLEPRLNLRGVQDVAFCAMDGAVDATVTVQELLAGARGHGARLILPCELTGIRLRGRRITRVETSRGAMDADRLVVAAGTATHQLAALAGIEFPQTPTPGVIATTAPQPPLLNTVVIAPGIYLRQNEDGRVVLGEPSAPPGGTPRADAAQGERLKALAARYLPDLATAAVDNVTVGWRPMPGDGKPIVGAPQRCPAIYLALMHSGVSLAGVVGRLAALELVDDARSELLRDFRVERFASGAG